MLKFLVTAATSHITNAGGGGGDGTNGGNGGVFPSVLSSSAAAAATTLARLLPVFLGLAAQRRLFNCW